VQVPKASRKDTNISYPLKISCDLFNKVLDWSGKGKYNHISSCGGVPKNKITMNFEEYASKLEDVKNLYAGFETLTDQEVVSDFLGKNY
jgi:hypothetical protein